MSKELDESAETIINTGNFYSLFKDQTEKEN